MTAMLMPLANTNWEEGVHNRLHDCVIVWDEINSHSVASKGGLPISAQRSMKKGDSPRSYVIKKDNLYKGADRGCLFI